MNTLQVRPKLLVLIQVLFFLSIAAVDQLFKRWAQQLNVPFELPWVHFFPYQNSGVIGGYLSDINPWIVRIFFSVLFGFLALGAFLLLHFMQHKRTPLLKWGIVVYFSGVLGNVWDRMATGKVVDYLIFQFFDLDEMAFNFADLVVGGGFVLICVALFKEADALWFEKNKRQGHWIAPIFQRNFGLMISLVGFAHFLVIALYSFTYLKVFLSEGVGFVSVDAHRIIRDYLIGLFIIEGFGLFLTFAASVLFSHRMVGPLIALEQYLKRIAERNARPGPFKLRSSDYFKDRLEAIAAQATSLSSASSSSPGSHDDGESSRQG